MPELAFFTLLGWLLGLALFAALIASACWMFNVVSRASSDHFSSRGVPVPGIGRAMLVGLAFVSSVVAVSVGQLLIARLLAVTGMEASNVELFSSILAAIAGFVINIFILAKMLPTTLGKATAVLIFMLVAGLFFVMLMVAATMLF